MAEPNRSASKLANSPSGAFRCTYCENAIPWEISPSDVGLRAGEYPRSGVTYPYSRCYCGFGKFVVYEEEAGKGWEQTNADQAEPPIRTHEKIKGARYARLPVDQVRPNPNQPRRFFDAEALRGLAESIETIGQLEDVLVRPVADGYELVLGERRWRAINLAGLPEISAKIVDLNDEEVRALSLIENIHRQDLTKVEEAFAFKSYVDEGHSLHEVGSRLGGMEGRVVESVKVLNSNYMVRFQEEKIRELEQMVEQLRTQLNQELAHESYEARIASASELVVLLEQGYEVAAVLEGGSFAVRRRKWSDLTKVSTK